MKHNKTRRRAARPLILGITAALLLAGCSNREEKLAEAIATANAAADRAEQAAKRAEAAAKNAASETPTETVINEVEPDDTTPVEDAAPAE
jgi:outer membrane murein-binding lipoprotein Lpp